MRLGASPPTISWLKDGNVLSSEPGIDISRPSGNMFLSGVNIDSATLANAGVYTCVGTNAAGTVSMVINVEVMITDVEMLGMLFLT